jgi:c-di-GMP-binding flagellar brake protein YcgR
MIKVIQEPGILIPMSDIDRRKYERMTLNTPATVRFPAGNTINGNTQDISLEGAVVVAPDNLPPRNHGITPGEIGFITIKFEIESELKSIMAPCEVKHLKGNGVGLSIDFLGLKRGEKGLIEKLLASGSQSSVPA